VDGNPDWFYVNVPHSADWEKVLAPENMPKVKIYEFEDADSSNKELNKNQESLQVDGGIN
jgi:hypothetical protein